jgi:hypothetical protein
VRIGNRAFVEWIIHEQPNQRPYMHFF